MNAVCGVPDCSFHAEGLTFEQITSLYEQHLDCEYWHDRDYYDLTHCEAFFTAVERPVVESVCVHRHAHPVAEVAGTGGVLPVRHRRRSWLVRLLSGLVLEDPNPELSRLDRLDGLRGA